MAYGSITYSKRFTLLLGIMIITLFLLEKAGVGATEKKGLKLEKISIGTPSGLVSPHTIIFLMGAKKGFYKTEGIEPEIFLGMKTPIIIAALYAGNLDFAAQAGEVIRAAATGMPMKLLFVITDRLAHVLMARPEIKSVKELKGKNIAVGGFGSIAHYVTLKALGYYGLDSKEVTILGTTLDAKLPALLSGVADAALLSSDEYLRVENKGFKMLVRVSDIGEYLGLGLGTTDKKINEKRDQVKRVLRATVKSKIYIKEHRDEAEEFVVKESGAEPERVKKLFKIDEYTSSKDGMTSDKVIQNEINIGRERGMKIKDHIPTSQVADFSILREVHKELGLTS